MANLACTIPTHYKGKRLDAILASLYPTFSRTQIASRLKTGHILVNGEACLPKMKLQGGEQVTFLEAAPTQQQGDHPENIPLTICYDDPDLLVIHKPAGLVVHPGAGNQMHTLVNALLFHCPALGALPRAGIIHRLDKDTTGLLLVAKHPESYHALNQCMRKRLIKRHYLALVQGRLTTPRTIQTAFGRDHKNRVKMAVRREGKEAVTQYQPLRQFDHFTLLHLALLTGRTHQIRVHLAYIKHPIVGDPLYGSPPPLPPDSSPLLKAALQAFKRQALHAYQLSFTHPLTHQLIQLEAPLPVDFQTLLTLLEDNANV